MLCTQTKSFGECKASQADRETTERNTYRQMGQRDSQIDELMDLQAGIYADGQIETTDRNPDNCLTDEERDTQTDCRWIDKRTNVGTDRGRQTDG